MLQEIAILLPQFVDLTGTIPYIKWIILAKQVIFGSIRPMVWGIFFIYELQIELSVFFGCRNVSKSKTTLFT